MCPTPDPTSGCRIFQLLPPHWLLCSPASAATVPWSHAPSASTWVSCPFCSQPGPLFALIPSFCSHGLHSAGLTLGRENASKDSVPLAHFLNQEEARREGQRDSRGQVIIWNVGVDLGWGKSNQKLEMCHSSQTGDYIQIPLFPMTLWSGPTTDGLEGVTQSEAEGPTQKPSRGGSPEGIKDP